MSQVDAVFGHLKKHGDITPLEALNQYGCFRLADVAYKLRMRGWQIETVMVESHSKHGTKRFAKYVLTSKRRKAA